MILWLSPGTTSVPLRKNFGGICPSGPPLGGTRSSGPSFTVRSSIALPPGTEVPRGKRG
ncbi:hypothetical protein THTE_0201 [Thermogutta terrifontis]|uniref:Uncharacterized protein n=1 Tax=Thermogutta terrifontis TaxID=1331910 RepID=A0A286RA29_9BACT|nr:hypothetical protein THTE_0201 [Thermogutta terrifontis]